MNTENLTGISKILMNAACAVSKLSQESPAPLDADKIYETLSLFKDSLLEEQAYVVEKRPEILACDVVRFQNNKTNGWHSWDCSTDIPMKFSQVCKTTTKEYFCPKP